MLTTLESDVRAKIQYCTICIMSLLVVPMDLDVKMKAVMLGACFLIVSAKVFAAILYDICFSHLGLHVL